MYTKDIDAPELMALPGRSPFAIEDGDLVSHGGRLSKATVARLRPRKGQEPKWTISLDSGEVLDAYRADKDGRTFDLYRRRKSFRPFRQG